jgi:hypothetical protein
MAESALTRVHRRDGLFATGWAARRNKGRNTFRWPMLAPVHLDRGRSRPIISSGIDEPASRSPTTIARSGGFARRQVLLGRSPVVAYAGGCPGLEAYPQE